ncbi:hypothetical protein D3C73_1241050 [compost metagenome]
MVALAVVQRCHSVLAHRVGSGESGLGFGNGVIIQMGNQAIRCLPCLSGGFAHNHVQANAKTDLTPKRRCFCPYLLYLFFHQVGRFTPGQIQINLLCGQFLCDVGRPAEVQWRMGLLHGREKEFCPTDVNVFTVKIHGVAL